MNFKGAAKQIEDVDIPRIASLIGIGEDVMHGVLDVESGGEGFDKKGRPKMLFEPHVFYRELPASKRDQAVKAGLAYKAWKPGAYPADSYPRLERAMKIDEAAALRSASWGLGQILGDNYRAAGYDTVQEMVQACIDDEENHLLQMVNFIKNSGLDDELRAIQKKIDRGQKVLPDDCRAFCRGYNGPGYEKNGYHTKMAFRVNAWLKIKDTPWRKDPRATPARIVNEDLTDESGTTAQEVAPEAEGDRDVKPAIEAASVAIKNYDDKKYHPEIEAIQKRLNELGYPEFGEVDGKWGTKTRAAVLAFRADNELPLDEPLINDQLMAALMVAKPRYVNPERANATIADLREKGAVEIKELDTQKILGYGVGAAGAVGAVGKGSEELEGYAGIFKTVSDAVAPIQQFVSDNFWLFAIGIGGFIVWKTGILQNIRVTKHRTGEDVST